MMRNSTPYRARKAEKMDRRLRLGLVSVAGCLGVAALLTIGWGFYREMIRSPFFRLADIEVRGNDKTTESEIVDAGDIQRHSSLLVLPVGKIRKKIEELPWIERAELRRSWPGKLFITVRERKPVAVANVEGQLYYMDGGGNIIAKISPGEDHDYPVISGLDKEVLERKEPTPPISRALQFLHYVKKSDRVLPRQNISEIAVQPAGDLIAYLADRPFPIYLGSDRMETRYYRLVKVLYRLYKKKEFEVTEFIKLDYLPEKVLVGKS